MAQINLSHPKRSTLNLVIAALVVSLIGGLIRFYFVLRVDFPLNDGGLFHAMIEDLLANNFILPLFTSYNFANIPYAYSPLPFYLAGALHNWFDWSVVDILRILPALLSTISIPVFFILAIDILNSREQAILATIAYALLLPAFEWLVMGGGLTRSLATLFSLAALHQTAVACKSKSNRSTVLSGIFLGFSVLSHPEIVMVTFTTIILFFVFLTRKRREWGRLALISGIAGLITLPYIIAVTSKHGITPFISAFQTGEFELVRIIRQFLSLSYTGEIYYTPFMVIAFLGLMGCFAEKKYLLPSWLAVMTIINPRSVERSAMIPVALLIGYGLDQIILPALGRLAKSAQTSVSSRLKVGTDLDSDKGLKQKQGIGIALLVVLFFQTGSLLLLSNQGNVRLAPVPVSERMAMAWVAQNTPTSGLFLVLSNSKDWSSDKAAEWFPVLSQRSSVNTVQGLEWLPGRKFSQVQQETVELKECLFEDVKCLENWSEKNARHFTYIYLSKSDPEIQCGRPCILPIEESLRNSSHFRLIFENESAAVLEKVY
jgi:hypothetical protein